MSAWTSARDGHVQTSPLLNANSTRPSTALSRNASSWAITSLKKMFGLWTPSSAVTGMMFSAAYCIISLPVVVSPVNPIFAIRGLVARARPGRHLRRVHGARPGAHEGDQAGQPARHRDDGRAAGVDRAAREDLRLRGHRPRRGLRGPDRWSARHDGGALRRRVLLPADDPQG